MIFKFNGHPTILAATVISGAQPLHPVNFKLLVLLFVIHKVVEIKYLVACDKRVAVWLVPPTEQMYYTTITQSKSCGQTYNKSTSQRIKLRTSTR